MVPFQEPQAESCAHRNGKRDGEEKSNKTNHDVMSRIPLLFSVVYKSDLSSQLFEPMYFHMTPLDDWVG